MKIAVLGAGFIGATLVRKLSAAGHTVLFANSRRPETLRDLAKESGATAVIASDAVKDVDVIILSIPLKKMPPLKTLLAGVPSHVPVIDTSNYYPLRDGHIAEIDEGQVEGLWVAEQIGRPVTKAWNAVLAGTLRKNGKNKGEPGRTAIPVAGNDARAKQIAMELVEATGFDAVDAGSIEDSWRIQTGNPSYCTELTVEQLRHALTLADRTLAPRRRDAGMAVVLTFGEHFDNDDLLRLNRAIMRFPK
jgi:8-hydroxy-5-deazaflavin:NADPH oxidoreductase